MKFKKIRFGQKNWLNMIKCRTKKLAIKGTKILNKMGIYCEYDGYYNIYAFKSSEDEDKGFDILEGKSNNLIIWD